MPKKMTKRKTTNKVEEADKVAFQVRFDRDLHQRLVKHSELTGISLNQLVQGMCRALMGRAHVGAPTWKEPTEDEKYVTNEPERGCIWFGKPGHYEEGESGVDHDPGQLWFSIDVREKADVHYEEK